MFYVVQIRSLCREHLASFLLRKVDPLKTTLFVCVTLNVYFWCYCGFFWCSLCILAKMFLVDVVCYLWTLWIMWMLCVVCEIAIIRILCVL